jgi:hypothetical protein
MSEGGTRYEGAKVLTISDGTGSALSSPPPTKDYGGSEISFPEKTQSTSYEGSLLALPPSALPQDPFATPRVSAGIILRRYIQSEEDISQHVKEEEWEEGMAETTKVYTTIPRRFDISDSTDINDDTMMEVEWRREELYMTPTKK